MRWENLRTNDCQYCGKPLHEQDGEICCTVCLFHIEPARFKKILEHRAGMAGRPAYRMKWQNLKNGYCPIDGCGGGLEPRAPGATSLQCSLAPHCSFRIREERLHEILRDPTHPANRDYSHR